MIAVGTRASRLALKQTDIAVAKLGLDAEVKAIKTGGDKSQKQLKDLGGRAFTRELDDTLLSGEVDLTVHSLKDIPVEDFPSELEIACIIERADPRDCLISNHGTLSELASGAVVGASSGRRKAELLNLRSDIEVKPLRGNVPTRIKKLDDGEYDAIVTAKCALDRLGLGGMPTQVFNINQMVPAAGQGAIAVVKRSGFDFKTPTEFTSLFEPCMLERFFISGLGACRSPVGAYCTSAERGFKLTCLIYKGGVRVLTEFTGGSQEIKEEVLLWKGKSI